MLCRREMAIAPMEHDFRYEMVDAPFKIVQPHPQRSCRGIGSHHFRIGTVATSCPVGGDGGVEGVDILRPGGLVLRKRVPQMDHALPPITREPLVPAAVPAHAPHD